MRKVYIDLGANTGYTVYNHAKDNPEDELFAIEPNHELCLTILRKIQPLKRPVNLIWAAAWTKDGIIDFYESGANAGSTVVLGKVERGQWPQIKYDSPTSVPSLDFSRWLLQNFSSNDDIFLKMDIEGGEYDILEKMIVDRSIGLVRKLRCEWHQDRYPSISRARHDALRSRVSRLVELEDWT